VSYDTPVYVSYVLQVNWNVFKFVITRPRQMIKATGRTVHGRQLHTSISSFVRNLDIAFDKLTLTERHLECWHRDRLLALTAKTMFDAIFNTIFGQNDSSQFNSQLAYHNFQARTLARSHWLIMSRDSQRLN